LRSSISRDNPLSEFLPQPSPICPECHSYGYKGRTGIFEAATMDEEMTTLIRSSADHQQLLNCLRKQGVRSMMQDGLEKAAAGTTSIDELTRVCGCPCQGQRHPAADSLLQSIAN
jgi:type II secretory ATPase GspE/PulE/Tfp pilus assembly ATPase PilB-like protein